MKNSLKTLLGLYLVFCAAPVLAQQLAVDSGFTPTVTGGIIKATAIQPDQKILIGGDFTTVNGTTAKRLVRLNSDGTIDSGFLPDVLITNNRYVSSIQVLADGRILISGDFGPVGSPTDFISRKVLRLNEDGSLDSTLSSQPRVFLPASEEREVARQSPNGKIWLCGNSNSLTGLGPARLARFNNDGSVDTTFVPIDISALGGCRDVEIMPDGKTVIAAYFSTVSGEPNVYGQPRPGGVARLNADDTLDTGFALATFGQNVRVTIADLQPRANGNLYFSYSTDQAPSFPSAFVRVDSSGANRTVISPSIGPGVFLSSGKSLFIGGFGLPGGNRFIRFHSNDVQDTLINTVLVAGTPVKVLQQSDGKILAATSTGITRYVEQPIPIVAPFDFDGDGKTDVSVFRPSDRYWYTHLSSNGAYAFTNWGLATDKLVAGDYDSDGKTDVAVYRDTEWYILRSSDSVFESRSLGNAGGMPFTADLDNDGLLDMLIRERNGSSAQWRVRYGNGTQTGYGPLSGENWTDTVVIGNFTGDTSPEYGYFRNGDWLVQNPVFSEGQQFHWGTTGDIPVPGDYDGDARTDLAVFRPSDGNWYILGSQNGYWAVHWGLGTDIPVPGDYDGDDKTDFAVYRGGDWYMLNSTAGYTGEHWGAAGDIPIPAQFLNQAGIPRPSLQVKK